MINIRCTEKLDITVIFKLSQLLTKLNVNTVKHSNKVSFNYYLLIIR